MCSGRVSKEFILKALYLGAGMILIGACHLPYDCHYINGNHKMKTRTDTLKNTLTETGMNPQRFRVEYVSAAEGIHYAEIIKEIDQQRKNIGTKQIKEENEKLRPTIERLLKTSKPAT
jgi:coenzyme F420-reducing hydrogenase delta subunit